MDNPCFRCNEYPCSWECIDKTKYNKQSVKVPCPFCGEVPSKIELGKIIIVHKRGCFLSSHIQGIMNSSFFSNKEEEEVIQAWNNRQK